MPDATQLPTIRRFGAFEVNLQSEELRKNGIRLRLSGQPFQVLAVLIERPGEVVSREELHSKLWPSDTFVDFDHGLNNAVARIREVLDDSPDTPRYVETIPRRGYRFIASLANIRPATVIPSAAESGVSSAKITLPDASAPSVLASEKRAISIRLKVLLGAAAVLAVAAAVVLYRSSGAKGTRQLAITSLAVLPLKNLSGDPTQEYLADGMTEELIGRLAGIRNLRVISRTSVMHFKDTKLSVPEIAKTLGVDAVVEGSVMREGSRIRVHAQLIRGATDEHFWSEEYDRDLRDVLALQSDVAQAIAQKVKVTVSGEEHNRLAAARPISPEVYENYLKGISALDKSSNRTTVEESIAYFNEAIRKDPRFAPSYLGLANAYSTLATVMIGGVAKQERPRAILAARKALELDPELVEAHVLLADMALQQWRWAESEAEFQRALELSPNNAAANGGFSAWLASQGRIEEALTSCRRGRELDPFVVTGKDLAWILFYARRYDDAAQELRSTLAVTPDDAWALNNLGVELILDHHPQEAVTVLEKAVSVSGRSPTNVGLLIHAYAQAGRRADALRLLGELKHRKQTGYLPAFALVLAYLGLGERDQTFFWLEEAYKEQSNPLQYLKVFPIFDPIRDDPRFKDLLRRIGLPE